MVETADRASAPREVNGNVAMGQKLAVVVAGATGNQGGAVVKSLAGRRAEARDD
jgi:hypothetical protein